MTVRWFQFSVREWVPIVLILALSVSWWGEHRRAEQYRQEAELLKQEVESLRQEAERQRLAYSEAIEKYESVVKELARVIQIKSDPLH